VTEELQNKVSLEDFCRDNKIQRMDSSVRHAIINQLADICAKMHFSGLCHRDCYLCHFLLDIPSFQSGKIRLFVLDLHRAGIWKKLPRHYQIKDTAGIFFSSMDAGFSKRDALRFMARYSLHGKLD